MISPNFSQLGLRPRQLRIKRYHARFRAIMVKYMYFLFSFRIFKGFAKKKMYARYPGKDTNTDERVIPETSDCF